MLLPYRWPRPIRLAAYALATAILLYMCFAPSDDLPKVNIWDKEEHAIAWFVLAATGLILAPRRPRGIALFSFGLGAAVEVAQRLMGFGRDGDWHDVAAELDRNRCRLHRLLRDPAAHAADPEARPSMTTLRHRHSSGRPDYSAGAAARRRAARATLVSS